MSPKARAAIGGAILLVSLGCSLRGTPPTALHADLSYPRPSGEVCSNDEGKTSLRVEVTDQLRAVLPLAPVYLIPVHFGGDTQGGPMSPLAAYSDDAGVATFQRLGKRSRYTVVVSMPGFVPEMRAIEVAPGCAGTLKVVLLVASSERLDAINAGRAVR